MKKIHEFDPQIYPFMLWVAVNPSLKDVTRMLYFLDQNRDVITPTQADLDGCGDSDSRTFEVASKATNREGYFVNLIKLKHCDSSVIAHEACHVADGIAERLGFPPRTFMNGEPYSYLVGWIVRCIEKAKKFKKKRK